MIERNLICGWGKWRDIDIPYNYVISNHFRIYTTFVSDGSGGQMYNCTNIYT